MRIVTMNVTWEAQQILILYAAILCTLTSFLAVNRGQRLRLALKSHITKWIHGLCFPFYAKSIIAEAYLQVRVSNIQ
jgi:hypothetical protein